MSNNNNLDLIKIQEPNNTQILIDSSDREVNETAENFSVQIDSLLGNNIRSIAVAECIIPASFYKINTTNNEFLIGTTQTITVPVGNYSTTTFLGISGTLTNALNNASLGTTFSTSYSSIDGLLTINSADSSDFTITTNDLNNSYLGMERSSSVSSSSGTWTSPNVLDLSGTKYIEIRTSLDLNSTTTINYNRSTLARIPVDVPSFNTIVYTASSFKFVNSRSNFYNSIRFMLYDDRQQPLSLNGLDYTLILLMKD